MIIGYQGEIGSNAQEAARCMAEDLGFENVEWSPLVSSQAVVTKLINGKIDYGVVAIKNNLGGRVQETFDAIRDEHLELINTVILDIHHCLFKKPGTDTASLRRVASHVQALAQTRDTRKEVFPNLVEMESPDTAIAAQWLSKGKYENDVAVLCKKEAGLENGLELVYENLEDRPSRTEFRMFRLSDIDYENNNKPSLKDSLINLCVSQTGLGNLSKIIIVLGIAAMLFFGGSSVFDSVDIAVSLGGAISAIFLFLTSKKARTLVMYRALKGYWKYYSVPDEGRESGQDLLYETPRIVEIDEVDDTLSLRGWICDKAATPFFESSKTVVSASDKARGCLVYWYQNPSEVGRKVTLNGFAELNWQRKHLAAPINQMSGRYSGSATKETGTIRFLRITKEEYEVHKRCEFLGKSE